MRGGFFDAFGKPTIKDGSGNTLTTSTTPFLFTGREYDSETGLYHYRARAYSAELGRFLQPDPIDFNGGDANIYRYCGNDPVNWIDSFGLSKDSYVPDTSGKHGGPHVDRYDKNGNNKGRYRPDGTPIPHKGKIPPPIPNSDKDKFKDAADKCKKFQEENEQKIKDAIRAMEAALAAAAAAEAAAAAAH